MAEKLFPIYEVNDTIYGRDNIIENDHSIYERWKKAFLEFENVQEEIVEAMNAADYDNWGQMCTSLWTA